MKYNPEAEYLSKPETGATESIAERYEGDVRIIERTIMEEPAFDPEDPKWDEGKFIEWIETVGYETSEEVETYYTMRSAEEIEKIDDIAKETYADWDEFVEKVETTTGLPKTEIEKIIDKQMKLEFERRISKYGISPIDLDPSDEEQQKLLSVGLSPEVFGHVLLDIEKNYGMQFEQQHVAELEADEPMDDFVRQNFIMRMGDNPYMRAIFAIGGSILASGIIPTLKAMTADAQEVHIPVREHDTIHAPDTVLQPVDNSGLMIGIEETEVTAEATAGGEGEVKVTTEVEVTETGSTDFETKNVHSSSSQFDLMREAKQYDASGSEADIDTTPLLKDIDAGLAGLESTDGVKIKLKVSGGSSLEAYSQEYEKNDTELPNQRADIATPIIADAVKTHIEKNYPGVEVEIEKVHGPSKITVDNVQYENAEVRKLIDDTFGFTSDSQREQVLREYKNGDYTPKTDIESQLLKSAIDDARGVKVDVDIEAQTVVASETPAEMSVSQIVEVNPPTPPNLEATERTDRTVVEIPPPPPPPPTPEPQPPNPEPVSEPYEMPFPLIPVVKHDSDLKQRGKRPETDETGPDTVLDEHQRRIQYRTTRKRARRRLLEDEVVPPPPPPPPPVDRIRAERQKSPNIVPMKTERPTREDYREMRRRKAKAGGKKGAQGPLKMGHGLSPAGFGTEGRSERLADKRIEVENENEAYATNVIRNRRKRRRAKQGGDRSQSAKQRAIEEREARRNKEDERY